MSVAFLTTSPAWPFPGSTIAVEVAWGANLAAASSTWAWTDITADVRQGSDSGITITRGRADESSQAQPATGTLDLLNTSGNYSAYNPASANYPFVRRNTPARVWIDLNDGNGPHIRLFGFAVGWVPSWDSTGNLAIVTLTIAGVLRRLGQGTPSPRSPMRRFYDNNQTNLLAYWPLEDGTAAVNGASMVAGIAPLTAVTGATQQAVVKFGVGNWRTQTAGTGFEILNLASQPLASLGSGGSLTGTLRPGTLANVGWVVQFAGRAWSFDAGIDIVIARWTTTGGTFTRFEVFSNHTAGLLFLYGYDALGAQTTLVALGFTTPDIVLFRVAALQNGGNVNYDFRFIRNTSTTRFGSFGSTTIAGTLAWPTAVTLNATNAIIPANPIVGSTNQIADTVVGHFAVYQASAVLTGTPDPCSATSTHDGLSVYPWAGFLYEQAHTRLARLCAEEAVPIDFSDVLSMVDGTFEYGLPWTVSGGTITRVTSQAHTGTHSLQLVVAGSPTQTWTRPNVRVPVVEGQSYRLTFWAFSTGSISNFRTVIDWWDAGGVNFLSTTQTFTQPAGVWTLYDVTYTAATGAVTATYGPTMASSPANGTTVFVDDVDLRNVTSSPVAMGVQPTDVPLNLLRECETADIGVLYDGYTAGLSYVTGQNRSDLPASLTADMALQQVDDPFSPADDDQRNRNLWTVSRPGGAVPAVYQDKTGTLGTDAIGVYADSKTVNVWTDPLLPDYASWGVHVGTVEGYRYPVLNLDLVGTSALVANWILCGLIERIDLLNVSSAAPQHAAGTVMLVLEGYTETLTPYQWKVAANSSKFDPWRVLLLASDTGDTGAFIGRADTDGSTVCTAVSIGGTSMTVNTPSGPVWTTAADDYPLGLTVAGNTITATAIAALLTDAFGRTVASGWSTADTGQTYTLNQGSGAYAVGGGQGQIGPATIATTYSASIAGIGPDIDVVVQFIPGLVATGAQLEQRIRVRDNGSTYYETLVQYQTTGLIDLYLQRGASVLQAVGSAMSYGAGTTVNVHLQAIGSTIRHKIWDAAAGSEPAAWAASVTDTTYAGAATDALDLAADRITGNSQPAWAAKFDNLVVKNLQVFTVTGVARALPAGSAVNVAIPATLAF